MNIDGYDMYLSWCNRDGDLWVLHTSVYVGVNLNSKTRIIFTSLIIKIIFMFNLIWASYVYYHYILDGFLTTKTAPKSNVPE